jgi:hypothetical protein
LKQIDKQQIAEQLFISNLDGIFHTAYKNVTHNAALLHEGVINHIIGFSQHIVNVTPAIQSIKKWSPMSKRNMRFSGVIGIRS